MFHWSFYYFLIKYNDITEKCQVCYNKVEIICATLYPVNAPNAAEPGKSTNFPKIVSYLDLLTIIDIRM